MVLGLLGLGADRQYTALFQLVKEDRAEDLLAKLQQTKLPAGGLDEIRGGKRKFTLLQKAVWSAKPRCVQLLLQLGASCTMKDEDGRMLFHILVLGVHNCPEQLHAAVNLQNQLLASLPASVRAQLDVPDRDGTPLLLALMHQFVPLAMGFLAAGFKLNTVLQGDKSNALHLATLQGNAALRAELLQAAEQTGHLQGMANQPTLQGTTPLHAAVSRHVPEMVSQLLQLPCIKINAQDASGSTPLHLAMKRLAASSSPVDRATYAELVVMLLEHNAAIDVPDRDGNTCLSLAIDFAMMVVRRKAGDDAATTLLQPFRSISCGEGGSIKSDIGQALDTPSKQEGVCAMHVAAMLGEVSLISGLINRGAQVDIQDERGQLPSVLAVRAGHRSCLMAMFGPLGANPLLLDKQGMSAVSCLLLHPTPHINQADLKVLLLAAVDSPNLPDNVSRNAARGLAVHPVCSALKGCDGPMPLLPSVCLTGNLQLVKALVEEAGMLPDLPSSTQATPLSTTVAALCASPTSTAKFGPVIEYLVQQRANPVRPALGRDRNGSTPLGSLIDHGHLDVVMAILRCNRQHVDYKAPSGATALYLAIVQGNITAVRELVTQLGAKVSAQQQFTPLHVAVGCQQPAVVQLLLGIEEVCAGMNQPDCYKRTPLAYCYIAWRTDTLAATHISHTTKARSSDFSATQVQLAQLLLQLPGCDPNVPWDASGRRVLHMAVEQGHLALIKMMAIVARGLDPNLRDAEGVTPLYRAVQKGDVTVVQTLASLSQPVQVDMSVFKACMQLLDSKPSLCEPILAVLMHASKGSIDLSNTRSCTLPAKIGSERVELPPLHHVARLDKAKMVEVLIKQGKAAVSAVDSRGLTALHHAVACKAVTAANALVNNGADISALGNAPTTPLIAAAAELDVGMVAILLSSKQNYNINTMDGQGHTALTVIIQRLLESSQGASRTNSQTCAMSTQPSSHSQGNLARMSPHVSGTIPTGSYDARADISLSRSTFSSLLSPKPTPPNALDSSSSSSSLAPDSFMLQKPSAPLDVVSPAEDILRQLLRAGADANQPVPRSALRDPARTLSSQLSSMISTRSVLPPTPHHSTARTPRHGPMSSPCLLPSPRLSGGRHTSPRLSATASGLNLSEAELFTPLLLAVQVRAESVVQVLLEESHDDLDVNGEHSWPAVQVAVQCIQLLLTQNHAVSEPQPSVNIQESRSFLDKILKSKDLLTAASSNTGNGDDAVDSAVRVLQRLLQSSRLNLNVPFEGLILQQMAEMGGPYASKVVRLLLAAPGTRPNVNAQHPKTGSTALHTVAAKHDKELVEVLANAKGIDFNILDNEGHTPLAVAVQAGARHVITSLLHVALSNDLAAAPLDPLKCGDDPASSPMALAVAHAEHKVLQALVSGLAMANNMVAQTNAPHLELSSSYAQTPAPAPASAHQYDIEAVLNQPIDAAGRTPVLVACKALQLDHAQVLVKTERQTWPSAALDVAEPEPLSRTHSTGSMNGHVDAERAHSTPMHMVLEHIITLQAQLASRRAHGDVQGQRTRACTLASDMASAPSMAAAVGIKDAVGFTPLHWAVMAKLDDVVQILCPKARKLGCINASADTDKGQGFTALHLAVHLNAMACARSLLLHGASLSAVMRDGCTTALHMCPPEHADMKILLLNPPAVIVQSVLDTAAGGATLQRRGAFASGYEAFTGQLAYTWKQVKDADEVVDGTASFQKRKHNAQTMEDMESAARGRQASKTLYQVFRDYMELISSAMQAIGPLSQAMAAMCSIAQQLLDGVDKLAYSNMMVAHVVGRIKRQVPTLVNLKTALEQSKNEQCARQLLPHIHQLGEVYIKLDEMIQVWSSMGRAAMLARVFASQEFFDDLMLHENILTGCMTDLGTVVNSFHLMGIKIQADCEDPEKLKADVKNLIRQDMQMAMQHMLEAEAMGGDVREAQSAAVKLFKEYGLDYNKLKKKEQRKWRGDKLKELIIAPSELQIVGKVGTGGSAQVFRALYQGHPVAYKQFEALPNQGDVLREGVENEAYIMSQLRHPNIIQIYGAVMDKEQRSYGLVVDYHAPGSLQNMIDSRMQAEPVSVQERVALVLQIALGMAYLHTRSVDPIVHGDLKPSNVLISEDGRAVITDFGLSRVISNSTTTTTTAHRQSVTFTSDASAVYTAPEVPMLLLNKKRKPPSTDVFSFGVLCLELLTLQPCYTGFAANPEEYMQKVSQGLRPTVPEELPVLLRECIQLCWDHDPEKRPTFVEVVDNLDRVYASIT